MDFVKWSARYGKHKIYKILLFFILFCVFSFFINSCKAHALTTISDQVIANSYFQTQFCVEGSTISEGITYNCSNGPSLKFSQYLNSDQNLSVPALITSGQLMKNFSYEILLDEPITISSTDRYLVLQPPFIQNSSSYSSDSSFYYQFNGGLTLNAIKNGSSVYNSPATSVFSMSPKYCSYYDSNNHTQACNINIVLNTSLSKLLYYIDIPIGTTFSRINLYFGNKDLSSSYNIKYDKVYGEYRPLTNNYDSRGWNNSTYCNTSSVYNNFWCNAISWENYKTYYNSTSYSVKRGFSDIVGAGLIHYYYSPYESKFNPSNITQNLWLDTSIGTTNFINFSYSSLSSEDISYYDNLMGTINQELNPSNGDVSDSWFEDSLDSFINGAQANSMTSILYNLIAYPIQKFEAQADEKFTHVNGAGDQVLSNHICVGENSFSGEPGDGISLSWHGASFSFPCLHSDIYSKLTSDNFSFYPTTLNGVPIQGGKSKNLYSIIKIIIDGILIYYMFITCAEIYKYILDPDDTKIEVLDL